MKLKRSILTLTLALAALSPLAASAQSADGRTDWPGAGQLFVGTNYQPFDRADKDQILRDIARTKQAGMKVVRMGDLSWDSFEPAEGSSVSTFDWIMDRMQAASLRSPTSLASRLTGCTRSTRASMS
jgi:beta-galactosidase